MIPESSDLLIPTVIPRAINVIWNSCGPLRLCMISKLHSHIVVNKLWLALECLLIRS